MPKQQQFSCGHHTVSWWYGLVRCRTTKIVHSAAHPSLTSVVRVYTDITICICHIRTTQRTKQLGGVAILLDSNQRYFHSFHLIALVHFNMLVTATFHSIGSVRIDVACACSRAVLIATASVCCWLGRVLMFVWESGTRTSEIYLILIQCQMANYWKTRRSHHVSQISQPIGLDRARQSSGWLLCTGYIRIK